MGASTRWSRSGTACPWFSPVWCRKPHITVLHHVHGPMWDQILPGPLAAFGRMLEARIAPPFYRRSLTVTPSDATREELLELGFRPDRVTRVPERRRPDLLAGRRQDAPNPSIVAVGRLAPVKRFELVIDAAVEARRRVAGLTVTIVGDGPEGDALRAQRATSRRRHVESGSSDASTGRPRRRVPAGVAGGQRVAGGRLGSEPHRGRGVRYTGRGDRHPRPPQQRGRRGHRCARRSRPISATHWPGCSSTTVSGLRLGQAALERARTLTWDASALGIMPGYPIKQPSRLAHRYASVIVVPTYNEAENIEPFLRAVRKAAPDADVLVVDDNSPDGTGRSGRERRRRARPDQGAAPGRQAGPRQRLPRTGSRVLALDEGYDVVVSMDADFSHDPGG